MQKRIITIAAMLFLAVAPLRSQIFILSEEEMNTRATTEVPPLGVLVPNQDVPNDQFVPLGEGVLLLAGMGGAFLVAKRKKE